MNKNMILDFSDIMDTSSKVLDNNLETFYNSEERSNASWSVRLDTVYDISYTIKQSSMKNAYRYLLKDGHLSMTVIDKFA